MGQTTKIEWADHTFNPWRGCSKVAPGCANCYAETMAKRFPDTHGIWGENGKRVVAVESYWKGPIKWNRNAAEQFPIMGDKFNTVEDFTIPFYVMEQFDRRAIRNHSQSIRRLAERGGLTKLEAYAVATNRPYEAVRGTNNNKVRSFLLELAATKPRVFCASVADVFEDWLGKMHDHHGQVMTHPEGSHTAVYGEGPNVTMTQMRDRLFRLIDETQALDWLLVTKRPGNIPNMWPACEADTNGDGDCSRSCHKLGHRYRENAWLITSIACQDDVEKNVPQLLKSRDLVPVLGLSVEPLIGPVNFSFEPHPGMGSMAEIEQWERTRIDWVIVGGESGDKARPCNIEWIRSIVRQCQYAGVPCFVKQLGAKPYIDSGDRLGYTDSTFFKTKDSKGGDWDEWPEDLRVRQLPTMKRAA